jgi:hypothetical protein
MLGEALLALLGLRMKGAVPAAPAGAAALLLLLMLLLTDV